MLTKKRWPCCVRFVAFILSGSFFFFFFFFFFLGTMRNSSWQIYFRKCRIHTWIYCQEFKNAMPHACTCMYTLTHTSPLLAYPFSHLHLHTLTCSHSLSSIFSLILLGYHEVHIHVKLHTWIHDISSGLWKFRNHSDVPNRTCFIT